MLKQSESLYNCLNISKNLDPSGIFQVLSCLISGESRGVWQLNTQAFWKAFLAPVSSQGRCPVLFFEKLDCFGSAQLDEGAKHQKTFLIHFLCLEGAFGPVLPFFQNSAIRCTLLGRLQRITKKFITQKHKNINSNAGSCSMYENNLCQF